MANPFEEELQRRQSEAAPVAASTVNPFEEELLRRQPPPPPKSQWEQGADAMRGQVETPPEVPVVPQIPGQSAAEQHAAALRPGYNEKVEQMPQIQASRMGMDTSGAPQDLRKAYLQMSPSMRDQYSETLVNRYFHQKTNGNADYVPVQYNETVGTHLFKDPDDGRWKPLNDIGIDLEDTREVAKYIGLPVGASLGSAIGVGALTGSPWLAGTAALGADVAVSGMVRASDVNSLLEQELLPPDVSASMEGVRESGWALLGNVVGGTLGKVTRKSIGGVDDIPMAVDVDRKTVDALLKRYDEEYGGQMPNLTLDEKMDMVAKTPKEKAAALRVRSRKETLQVSVGSREKLIQRQMENREAFTNGLDTFLQVVGKGNDPGVFRSSGLTADELLNSSSNIINTLEGAARTKLKQYDAVLADSYAKASQTADDVLRDATDPDTLPASFAGVFDTARANFKQNMGAQYDAIRDATGGQKTFDISPVKSELKTLRRRLQEDARFREAILGENTQGLTPRPDIRVGEAPLPPEDDIAEVFFGDVFRPDRSGLLLSDGARREMAEQTNFGYKEVNSALDALRSRLRRLPHNIDPRTRAQLTRLESTLEDVRTTGLAKIDPELASSQQALDATYKIGLDALDRGIGKKLADQYLAPRPGMDGLLKPSTFDKLFKGDAGAETARDIRTLMDMDVVNADPSNPIDMLGVTDNVRRGLLGKLKQDLIPQKGTVGETRVLTPESFVQFKKDYRHALELAMRPGELDKIENMTGLRRVLEKAEADNKAVREKISQMPWGSKELANDPAQLIRKTWGPADDPTKLKRSRQLRQALREQGDPDGLITDYRKLIAHDMMSNVTDKNTGMVDPFKLDQYLNRHQELLTEWYTSPKDRKSGLDLVDGMKSYAEIGKSLLGNARLTHADQDPLMRTVNSLARAYVGVFTTPGRILTAAKQLGGGVSISKEADFILNPRKYVRNEAFYDVLNSPEMRALNRAGGHAIINSLRYEGEERPTDEPIGPTPLFPVRGDYQRTD